MKEKKNLYFITTSGERRLIAENIEQLEVLGVIKSFLDERKYTSYYTRSWDVESGTMYDVGSYTEFFLWGSVE